MKYLFLAAILVLVSCGKQEEVPGVAWGVSFWRSGFAAITIYIIYRSHWKTDPGRIRSWFTPFHFLSAVCYALLLVLFVLATKLTTSANAIFLQYTAPIYVLF